MNPIFFRLFENIKLVRIKKKKNNMNVKKKAL